MGAKIRRSVADRFWEKVAFIGAGPGECWEWHGSLDSNGYGKFHVAGRPRWAHRVSWELSFGPIPEGLLVCHRCDNRPCVHPSHFFLGTVRDNGRDCADKGRAGSQRLMACDIAEIRSLAASSVPNRELAERFGCTTNHIWSIVHGRVGGAKP